MGSEELCPASVVSFGQDTDGPRRSERRIEPEDVLRFGEPCGRIQPANGLLRARAIRGCCGKEVSEPPGAYFELRQHDILGKRCRQSLGGATCPQAVVGRRAATMAGVTLFRRPSNSSASALNLRSWSTTIVTLPRLHP